MTTKIRQRQYGQLNATVFASFGAESEKATSAERQRVAKYFSSESGRNEQLHYGTLVSIDKHQPRKYRIDYDEDHTEDMDQDELQKAIRLYKRNQRGDKYPTITELDTIGREYVQFLYHRMHVWCQRYEKRAAKETVLSTSNTSSSLQREKLDLVSWKLMECTTTGNVYRHLDTGTSRLGQAIRKRVGRNKDDPRDWDESQIENAFLMALMNMAGFREDVLQEHVGLDGYPASHNDKKKLIAWLQKVRNDRNRVTIFHTKFQTQGMRWISYLQKSFTEQNLRETVDVVRGAKTWKEATSTLQHGLNGVGPYSAAQSLCTIFYGVFLSQPGLFSLHDEVVQSMYEETAWGPGPERALKQIFSSTPKIDIDFALFTLTRLVELEFDKQNLDFPYLLLDAARPNCSSSRHDSIRRLSCVDLEHSLCYYSRYLAVKKKLGKQGIDTLYRHYHRNKEFQGTVPLVSIKDLKPVSANSVENWCQRQLEQQRQELKRIFLGEKNGESATAEPKAKKTKR